MMTRICVQRHHSARNSRPEPGQRGRRAWGPESGSGNLPDGFRPNYV